MKLFISFILISVSLVLIGCSDTSRRIDRTAFDGLGLSYDFGILMMYPDLSDESLYVVVGKFMSKPSDFSISEDQLFVSGFTPNNEKGECAVKRKKNSVIVVYHETRKVLEIELDTDDFLQINSLIKNRASLGVYGSLAEVIGEALSTVLGEIHGNEFKSLLEVELGRRAKRDPKGIIP